MILTRSEFAELALNYLDELTAYARRLAARPWDADDLVQATYERAFHKWQTLREPSNCRAWLFRIARNLHIDHGRSTAARPELRLAGLDDAGEAVAIASLQVPERISRLELERALELIPGEQREAVLLSDLWGFRYQEIAEIVSVPVGTVRSRISRGRRALSEAVTGAAQPRKSGGGSQ